ANNIDSTFNKNPVVLQINADVAALQSGKVYKVTTPSNGSTYERISVSTSAFWFLDPIVTPTAIAPVAGNNTPLSIYNADNKVVFTYNRLGTVAPSLNPWTAGGKTKLKVKLYGYVNTPNLNTYVIQKDFNAVSRATRLSDSEFATDSVKLGTKLHFVSICYNQSRKYIGFADAIATDTLRVPISLFEVNSEQEIKTKIQNYLKP
ncbi:MAG TPA: hypothetical protein VL947_08520, partial [Cytophagales bacterium]|nr:hypothetical protein [Cytophagales bacterium]